VGRVGVRRALGIVVLVAGIVAGVTLWLAAARRYDDAVGQLAPAPIGCDTTLDFDRAGTYTFFVETKGSVGQIDGDCESAARHYDVASVPRVTLTLADEDGQNVDLARTEGPTYDRAGRRGEGIRSVHIDRAGTYVLTAAATSTEAMIRVGKDPSRGVSAIRAGAVAALVVGVVGSVLLIVLARPRRQPAPVRQPGPQWPTDLPVRPPVGPPTANPPIPPPYAPRPPSPAPPAERWPRGGATPPAARPPGGWPGRKGPLPPPSPLGERPPGRLTDPPRPAD
jgi:hypothetical protein